MVPTAFHGRAPERGQVARGGGVNRTGIGSTPEITFDARRGDAQ